MRMHTRAGIVGDFWRNQIDVIWINRTEKVKVVVECLTKYVAGFGTGASLVSVASSKFKALSLINL